MRWIRAAKRCPRSRRALLKILRTSRRFAASISTLQDPTSKHKEYNHDPLNLDQQGYVLVDVTPDDMVVRYRHIDTYDPDAVPYTGAAFRLAKGAQHVEVLAPDRQAGTTV